MHRDSPSQCNRSFTHGAWFSVHVDGYPHLAPVGNGDAARPIWQEISAAQFLLPAHVIQEYISPTRSFDPTPNFATPNLEVKDGAFGTSGQGLDTWIAPLREGGDSCAALVRGRYAIIYPNWHVNAIADRDAVRQDAAAVSALYLTRQQQLTGLIESLPQRCALIEQTRP